MTMCRVYLASFFFLLALSSFPGISKTSGGRRRSLRGLSF